MERKKERIYNESKELEGEYEYSYGLIFKKNYICIHLFLIILKELN